MRWSDTPTLSPRRPDAAPGASWWAEADRAHWQTAYAAEQGRMGRSRFGRVTTLATAMSPPVAAPFHAYRVQAALGEDDV